MDEPVLQQLGSLVLTHPPDPSDDDQAVISQGIKAFNDDHSPFHRAGRTTPKESLVLFLRDADGIIQGGLVGFTHWGWLYIDDLWIAAPHRQEGYGRHLVTHAEALARARGCRHAHLRTWSFQAPGFYQRLGYRVVGQMDGYPAGEVYYWLRKDLEG